MDQQDSLVRIPESSARDRAEGIRDSRTSRTAMPGEAACEPEIPSAKRCYVQTYGCQMNFYDSELVVAILKKCGYAITDDPSDADLVLLNTCSVREHAERRVFGRIGELKKLKDRKPGVIFGILGCMSQRLGEAIMKKAPHVDLVVGPDSYRRLPELLARIEGGEGKQKAVDLDPKEDYGPVAAERTSGGLRAWIAVQRGCNFACTYCIVPKVRGRERYRPIDEVVSEARRLVGTGTKEVILLGQTVNAYRDGAKRFDALLRACNEVHGLERIRFTTSHPVRMDDAVFHAMAECSKLCEFIHLPVQSGSDRVLRSMRRGYSASRYEEIIEAARSIVPGLAVATDIIVGYPGEKDADYEETLELVRRCKFDMVYPFKYSPRPGVPSAELEDDVPPEEKQRRIETLIRLAKEVARERNQLYVGTVQEVLVEERVQGERENRLRGRTRTNKPVYFTGPDSSIGQTVQVLITKSGAHSLQGRQVDAS